jgi:hypothetical protein
VEGDRADNTKRHQTQYNLPHRAEDAPQLGGQGPSEAVDPLAPCRHYTSPLYRVEGVIP